MLAAVRYVRDLTSDLGLGAARAATEFDLWLAAAKVPPASLAADETLDGERDPEAAGSPEDGTVRVMTVHASKGLEFPVCAVAECWGNPRSDSALASGPAGDGGRVFVVRPADLDSSVLAAIDPEELEPSANKSAAMPLAARYLALRAADEEGEAQERARLIYVALTRAREALVVGVAGATGKEGVCLTLAGSALDALSGGQWAAAPGVRTIEYGGSAPARLRCVVVEQEGKGAEKRVVADSAGCLAGFDGELPTDVAEVTRLGAGASAAGDGPDAADDPAAAADGPAPFDLFAPDLASRPTTPLTWRAREGVFSYSSVHALLSEQGTRPPTPTRAEREAEAQGAPATEDADRATNLGSAFHELAQAMVECGGVVDEGRIASQARQWNLSARAEGRLRAALARWQGSAIRAEALSWPLVRSEVPFFQPRPDSPHGDYLEGAIDLLCSDGSGERALVVDYKTGDAGLSLEEVRERHAMQADFYAGVLLAEGFSAVECAFVCVERDDPASPGEPLVVRYAFEA